VSGRGQAETELGGETAPTSGVEVELKLALTAAALDRLRAGVFANSPANQITSIYFDTSDYDLRRAGFSLRIRRTAEGWAQTIKGAGFGIQRLEDEHPIARGALEKDRLIGTPLAPIIAGRPLMPVFETRIRRRTADVQAAGGTFEMALDEGDIVAGVRRESVGEVELELSSGSPKVLFDHARTLAREGGLRIRLGSKAARGYALARGAAPASLAFAPPWLEGEMTAPAGLGVLAVAALRHLEANADLVRDGGGPEAVHQTRVALRRLRVFLGAFEDEVGKRRRRSLNRRLKALTRRFTDTRELDVLGHPLMAAFLGDPAERQALEGALERARTSARHHAAGSLREEQFAVLLMDTLEWTTLQRAGLPASIAHQPLRDHARDVLDHRRKRLRQRAHKLDWRDPRARHKLRIAAKSLRYLAEVFAPLFGDAGEYLDALRAFLDLAGDLNDIAVAPDAVREILGPSLPGPAAFSAGLTLGARRVEARSLLRQARKAWRAFESKRPFWRTR